MKKILTLASSFCICYVSFSQTLYVPSGTSGISTSPNGNIGIGHNNPDMKLDVRTSDVYISRFHYNSTSALSGIRLGRASSYGDLVTSYSGFGIGTGTSGSGLPLNSQNVSDINFFISNSSGYVGIGTTSPNAKITIEGDGSTVGSASINLKHSGNGMSIGLSTTNNNLVIGNSWNPESGTYLTIADGSGNVGIGTIDPQSKLAVNGQIRATEVKVLADISVPDYVFEADYELRTLKETKEYISENKHLPEIPSAAEIGENGIDLGDMNMRLLKKIEELTLYQIELMEKLEAQQKRIEKLENK